MMSRGRSWDRMSLLGCRDNSLGFEAFDHPRPIYVLGAALLPFFFFLRLLGSFSSNLSLRLSRSYTSPRVLLLFLLVLSTARDLLFPLHLHPQARFRSFLHCYRLSC